MITNTLQLHIFLFNSICPHDRSQWVIITPYNMLPNGKKMHMAKQNKENCMFLASKFYASKSYAHNKLGKQK